MGSGDFSPHHIIELRFEAAIRDGERVPIDTTAKNETVHPTPQVAKDAASADPYREIPTVAIDLARQIRSQYTIAYAPLSQALDETYRRIHVEARGREPLTVPTRAGYMASANDARGPPAFIARAPR